MAADDIQARMKAHSITQAELASAIGLSQDKLSKVFSGTRQWRGSELLKAIEFLDRLDRSEGYRETSDAEPESPEREYVPIEVLPTYAGMGGGGTGEGEREIALVPRALVVDVLRGKPSDFLLINVRGDSMEPDFRHGDQLLVDKRDISPAQPGPFALWDGEWGEYVVKNVERSRSGEVRIFSTNPKYNAEVVESETTKIIGRPVWFGRRL